MFLSFCALYVYVSRVSNFVKAVNTSLEDIRDGHYNAEEISQNIPFASETEFFELADKVTRLSSLIYNDVTLNKENVKKLEDEVLRLKNITTYTTSILNSLDSGIMVTDSLLRVSFVNYEFEKFWRIKRSSVVDTVVEDLPFIRLIDGWKDALKSGKPCYFKSKYKLTGKKSKEVDFCVMPLKDANGKDSIGTITLTKPSA
jgi:signal transduction histidine kinase